jgi:hypothetical protein
MGFKKANVAQFIRVGFIVNTLNKDTVPPTLTTEEVYHTFSYPTAADRQTFQRNSVKVKGRKLSTQTSEAAFILWQSCIQFVEGYDDLPSKEEQQKPLLVNYFSDDIGRLHVDEAIERLMSTIGAEDIDVEKKSVPSSGQ